MYQLAPYIYDIEKQNIKALRGILVKGNKKSFQSFLTTSFMAEITSTITQSHSSQPKLNTSSQVTMVSHHNADPFSASDDDIPTVDYSLLFSDNPVQRFLALENLRQACQEYGFFYVKTFTTLLYFKYICHARILSFKLITPQIFHTYFNIFMIIASYACSW